MLNKLFKTKLNYKVFVNNLIKWVLFHLDYSIESLSFNKIADRIITSQTIFETLAKFYFLMDWVIFE